MVRSLLLLVLFIVLSTSVFAVGLVPAGDVRAKEGDDAVAIIFVTGENTTRTYDFYAKSSNPDVVKFDGAATYAKTVSIGPLERKEIVLRMKGSTQGVYAVTYGLRETTSGMFQSNLERTLRFTVTDVPTTPPSNPPSAGGGGAGGGGGYIPPRNYTAPNASVAAIAAGEVPPPPGPDEQELIKAQLSGQAGGVNQPPSPIAQGVQAAADAVAKTVMSPEARRWGLIAIGVGLVMLILQMSVITLVKKEEA